MSGSKNAKRVCKWCKLELVPQGFNRMSFSDETNKDDADHNESSTEIRQRTTSTATNDPTRSSETQWSTNPLDELDDEEEETKTKGRPRQKTMDNDTLSQILMLPGNQVCVDCTSTDVEWASLSHGTVMCLQCSGQHRSYGVHISFVRSLKLDRWEHVQIEQMMLSGGNAPFWEFVAAGKSSSSSSSSATTSTTTTTTTTTTSGSATMECWKNSLVNDEYASAKCQWYRANLKQRASGTGEALSPFVEAVAGKDLKEMIGGVQRKENGGGGGTSLTMDSLRRTQSQQERGSTGVSTGDVKKDRRPQWVMDSEVTRCMHCDLSFSMLRRRHHCRKCGHCVCVVCAPNDNTRPIPEFGYMKDVRLCLTCFCPPSRRKKNGTGMSGGGGSSSIGGGGGRGRGRGGGGDS